MSEDKGARGKPVVMEETPKPGVELERVVTCWNGVIQGLMDARKNWEEMQKLLQVIPRDQIQNAPMPVQKATTRFRKASFNVMLGRLADYYRAFGGLDAMYVKGAK